MFDAWAVVNKYDKGQFMRLDMPLYRRWVFPLCASALITYTVAAQGRNENWARCESDLAPKVRIAACTALIESGKETASDLANDFSSRAFVYVMKGDYDRAIQDY